MVQSRRPVGRNKLVGTDLDVAALLQTSIDSGCFSFGLVQAFQQLLVV